MILKPGKIIIDNLFLKLLVNNQIKIEIQSTKEKNIKYILSKKCLIKKNNIDTFRCIICQ